MIEIGCLPIKSARQRAVFSLFCDAFILAFCGYVNLRNTLSRYNLCFVGPESPGSISVLYGAYRTFDKASYYFLKTPFDTTHTCLLPFCGWPDATTVNNDMSPYALAHKKSSWTAKLGDFLSDITGSPTQYITYEEGEILSAEQEPTSEGVSCSIFWDQSHSPFVEGYSRWCLHSKDIIDKQDIEKHCSKFVPSILANSNEKPFFPELPLHPPPAGFWSDESRVQCFTDGSSMGDLKEYTPRSRFELNWNLFKLPATLMLMITHIYMFLKAKTNVFYVADNVGIYDEVVDGEIWSVVSGAFINHSVAHLCWVLWNLWLIGSTVEDDYGSLTYFYLNIALIFILGLFTICGIWFYGRYTGRNDIENQVIFVGYGPVIFAWIFVACMERDHFPLVPFTDMYVSTSGWTFLVPLVNSVILASVLLPKDLLISETKIPLANISFSYSSAIFVGLLLHYEILPFPLLAPHLLIPFIVCVEMMFFGKITNNKYHISLSATVDGNDNTRQRIEPFSLGVRIALSCLRFGMMVCSLVGFVALDHATAVAGLAVTFLFSAAIKCYIKNGLNHEAECLLSGSFISLITVIMCDSLSIGSWWASYIYILSNPRTLFGIKDMCIFTVHRMVLNLLAMFVTTKILAENDAEYSIPEFFIGVFNDCRIAGDMVWGFSARGDDLEENDGAIEMEKLADNHDA